MSEAKRHYEEKYIPRPGSRPVYVYSDGWTEARDEEKFERMELLEDEIGTVERDITELLTSDDERDRQLGAAAALIVEGRMRAGTGQTDADTFGAQNLQKRHFHVTEDGVLQINYRGKGGKLQERIIEDGLLIRTSRELGAGKRSSTPIFPDLTYRRLLSWFDRYDILPKDFRTWWANRLFDCYAGELAATPLTASDDPESIVKAETDEIVERIAEMLGHTAETARRAYIRPEAVEDYRARRLSSLDRS